MKKTIALVDDDQNILTSVSLMLEAEGYEVDTYFDSEQEQEDEEIVQKIWEEQLRAAREDTGKPMACSACSFTFP